MENVKVAMDLQGAPSIAREIVSFVEMVGLAGARHHISQLSSVSSSTRLPALAVSRVDPRRRTDRVAGFSSGYNAMTILRATNEMGKTVVVTTIRASSVRRPIVTIEEGEFTGVNGIPTRNTRHSQT